MDFQNIPMDLVMPSPMNPRKTFDEEAVRELAANIEKQGLIQPITVRPREADYVEDEATGETMTGPDTYEIVCGERRYRAFCLLKAEEDKINVERVAAHRKKLDRFQTIPAIIRSLTDEEAFEAMITENLQRQDVDPMEEAFAFGQLIKTGKTAEEIALKFGKSVRFVNDRCKLNTLIPELMLAVKDDKMSIAAAMIICKLDEADQQKYHSQYRNNYQGMTRQSAQGFVDNLFMSLNKSLWYQSDNQADEDFDGGCNIQCSQCPLNTANHGCLFYEMKSEDAGRCTSRAKFQAKTTAYLLSEVEKESDRLVRKGEPLEYGKTVIAIAVEDYEPESSKTFKNGIAAMIAEKGFEVVNPTKVFKSKCWYDADDERTLEKAKTGEAYRVISLFNYDRPTVDEQYWYVKNNVEGSNDSGLPVDVTMLISKYQNTKAQLPADFVIECAKTMAASNKLTNEPLTELERKLFMLLTIQSNYTLRRRLKLGQCGPRDADYEYMAEHPDSFDLCVRAFLQDRITLGHNPELTQAEPILDELGALWCPQEYAKSKAKTQAKFEKSVAKITKQLADLGYDLEGNKLTEAPVVKLPTIKELKGKYDDLKQRHGDSIIFFRVGEEYKAIEQDASALAISFGLQMKNVAGTEVVTFPKSDLDSMLPQVIKAGFRVAICEQLDEVKKIQS